MSDILDEASSIVDDDDARILREAWPSIARIIARGQGYDRDALVQRLDQLLADDERQAIKLHWHERRDWQNGGNAALGGCIEFDGLDFASYAAGWVDARYWGGLDEVERVVDRQEQGCAQCGAWLREDVHVRRDLLGLIAEVRCGRCDADD